MRAHKLINHCNNQYVVSKSIITGYRAQLSMNSQIRTASNPLLPHPLVERNDGRVVQILNTTIILNFFKTLRMNQIATRNLRRFSSSSISSLKIFFSTLSRQKDLHTLLYEWLKRNCSNDFTIPV